jgi:hypothetical protein
MGIPTMKYSTIKDINIIKNIIPNENENSFCKDILQPCGAEILIYTAKLKILTISNKNSKTK